MSLSPSKPGLEDKLAKIQRDAEERDAKQRAVKLGYSYIDLKTAPVQIDSLKILSKKEAEEGKCAVLALKRDTIVVVVYDPALPSTKNVLDVLHKKEKNLEIKIGSLAGLKHIWNFYEFIGEDLSAIAGKVEIDEGRIASLKEALKSLASAKEAIENAIKAKVATGQILEIVLASALALKGSDIHFEPAKDDVKIRLRIDGLLHDLYTGLSLPDYFFILSRVKLLASMKLNIHAAAQDGRFSVTMGGKSIEIRASALPSEYGETVVLRVLDPDTIMLTLQDLGLNDEDLAIIKEELARPNGMILNTGPTGSGKTTTLYAFLVSVNEPESKIITLEDPIEYHLPGIEQTQVNAEAGYTFASGLRSIVRQDPDIILIGEIRDLETADIALNAALTGHLVFSTLHTNDSFGAIPRLVDLGVKTAILGPALNLIIAQRLVRSLCKKCKAPLMINDNLKNNIQKFIESLPARVPRERYKDYVIYNQKGCSVCNGIGYKGRTAVVELLRVDEEVNRLISKDISDVDIKKAVKAQGVVTVQQAGILRILQGVTTFEEVERITGPIKWP
ncbi:MAG: GspE/PulE family protein [bacterium]|nr:GspE/PulE family protein [bacterium]